MAGTIDDFFSAWGMTDPAARDAALRGTIAADVHYADPRTTVTGADDLAAYVAQYAASAPGAAAGVVEDRAEGDTRRVRVRFHGEGWEQFGRYEVTLDDAGRIARMTGVAERSA